MSGSVWIAKTALAVASAALLLAFLFEAGPTILIAGCLPEQQVESLRSSVAVRDWGSDGLHLADGRTVLPAGFTMLPIKSKALSATTKQGVEVASDGHVYGLVQIWHWCGNDALRYDIRRVDLGLLLGYLGEGKSDVVPAGRYAPYLAGGAFTEHGWSISDLVRFRKFAKDNYPRESAAMKL